MTKKKEKKVVDENQELEPEIDTSAETDELESALADTVIDQPVAGVDDVEGTAAEEAADAEPAVNTDQEPDDPDPSDPDPVDPEGDAPIAADTFADTKKASDKARNDRITEATKNHVTDKITEEEAAAIEIKQKLQMKLHECAEKIEEHEQAIEALKLESRNVMASLYPQNVKSDRHVDAVRGYLKSSDNERKNRGANPARLKEMLRRMAQSPVDAAFHRSRARGAGRPTRTVQGSQSGAEE